VAEVSKQSAPAAGARSEDGLGEASNLSFESALERLEDVVDRLEGGDLELEGALASFEEGVALTRRCAEQLDTAERRVEVLMKQGAKWVSKPFDAVADDQADDQSRSQAGSQADDPDDGEAF
jgi:exodeoxyribonuclease VII small subunit